MRFEERARWRQVARVPPTEAATGEIDSSRTLRPIPCESSSKDGDGKDLQTNHHRSGAALLPPRDTPRAEAGLKRFLCLRILAFFLECAVQSVIRLNVIHVEY